MFLSLPIQASLLSPALSASFICSSKALGAHLYSPTNLNTFLSLPPVRHSQWPRYTNTHSTRQAHKRKGLIVKLQMQTHWTRRSAKFPSPLEQQRHYKLIKFSSQSQLVHRLHCSLSASPWALRYLPSMPASSDDTTGQTSPTLRSPLSLSPSLSPSPWLCETCEGVRSGSRRPGYRPSCCGSVLRSETCWTFPLEPAGVQVTAGPRSGWLLGPWAAGPAWLCGVPRWTVGVTILVLNAVRFGDSWQVSAKTKYLFDFWPWTDRFSVRRSVINLTIIQKL